MRVAALPTLRTPLDGAPLLVGFSGGLDSTVLLDLLAAQPALRADGLRALHVDHGLHPDSAAWAAHCADTCARLGIDFESRRVAVRPSGGSTFDQGSSKRIVWLSATRISSCTSS